MRNIILLIVTFVLNAEIQSQTTNNHSFKADSLYRAKLYLKAGKAYKLAAEHAWLNTQKKNYYYNSACSYSLAKKNRLALKYLNLAIKNGYSDKQHMSNDSDLKNLHKSKKWLKLINSIKERLIYSTPEASTLITTDVLNFYKAFDLAINDSINATEIFKKEYFLKGSVGLQDFFSSKIRNLDLFSNYVLKNKSFYNSIRSTLLNTKKFKSQIHDNFSKLKSLYQQAVFPDVYIVIRKRNSNGTISDNGLLIGAEVMSKTPNNSKNWSENQLKWTMDFKNIPITTTHEIIHFNQKGMKKEKTLIKYALIEGSAEFITELITGKTDGDYSAFNSREKKIWKDFKKDMFQDKYNEWIDSQEPKRPRNAMYWAGYLISKSYYENTKNKVKAIYEILNIKNYMDFYNESKVEDFIEKMF